MTSSGGPDAALAGELESVAVEAAREAGKLLAQRFGTRLKVEYKDDRQNDPATDVDHESQALLRDAIGARFPDHGFVGEEDEEQGDEPAPDFIWAVDPLDGTKNYLNGFPIYACSIGVLYRGTPVAAALYVPRPGRTDGAVLHAHKGGGAFRDDEKERLSVLVADEPEGGRLATLPGMFGGAFTVSKPLQGKLGEARNSGSIAYDLALTAQGVLQYSLTGGGHIWDVAAGALLVQEAGGAAMIATGFRDAGFLGSGRINWTRLKSFFPQWDAGKTTLKQIRRWSEPMVMGSPGIADFVTANLQHRRGLKRRLRLRRSLRGRRK